ncbi:LysR family transcriptional regulator [Pseudonocardia sp. KRD291]|uniref:LysR family transcriptional regulator n=1 Tax=Pseudonocardia sp. KRD291 TaxID=2792007 RepID=UPI001C4A6419|nr:LysR family transcriptional regulator [Pseudonocardia sp. KRD291]MBW0105593.1 LysR family transcriptional regulator [Pseudonocardia sp. KRD291]
MELRQLNAFVVVAEELHFGRAAVRLSVSGPPLSQQIRRLEREVGTPLFARHTRHVALTPAGEAFLPPARRALAAAGDATTAARRAAQGRTGTARLGFAGSSSYQQLREIAQRFRATVPDARLSLVTGRFSGELAEDLRADRVDAALIRTPVDDIGLVVREVARQRLVAALPVEHPLADREQIGLAELCADAFVSYPAQRMAVMRGAVDAACLHAGFHPRIEQEAPDTHTLLSLVSAGVGVGLVLDAASELLMPGVAVVELADARVVPLALAWKRDGSNPVLPALLSSAGVADA